LSSTFRDALKLAKSRRVSDALELLQEKISESESGRREFLGKLYLAELCLEVKQQDLAYPILNELAETVDEFRLEEWEEKELVARVLGNLVRCCRLLDRSYPDRKDRANEVFSRLCRLDISLALKLGRE
jgi:hypothetical protein